MRTTIDIPEPLHNQLRKRADQTGASIRSLIISAIERTYAPTKGKYVTGPMVKGPGKLGPKFPKDENPHEIVFS